MSRRSSFRPIFYLEQEVGYFIRAIERFARFLQVAVATVIEGRGVGERERGCREVAQKRWPNLPPQPISPTFGSVPVFKTTLTLFQPFGIATRSAVIPSTSAFYVHDVRIYT